MQTKVIKRIVRVLCGLMGLLMVIPAIWCGFNVFFPIEANRLTYETLNGAYYGTEPAVIEECTTASGEMIRYYESYDELGREQVKITYQAPNGDEKTFYSVYQSPFVSDIDCQGDIVMIEVNAGWNTLYLTTKRIRTELIDKPLCYTEGTQCTDLGIVEDILVTILKIGFLAFSIGWLAIIAYLFCITIMGRLGLHH